MKRPLALVVDQDTGVREMIRDAFDAEGVAVLEASDGRETMKVLRDRSVDILAVDLHATEVDIFDLLRYATRLQPPPVFIGIASAEDRDSAVELIRSGALVVLTRPLDDLRLLEGVRLALLQHEQVEETGRLRGELQSREGYNGVVGHNPAMERLRERLHQLAPADKSVWFLGEPGTGRELAARTLHGLSPRVNQPFVVVPCAGTPVLEGVPEQVDRGTIYLEDVPTLSSDLQGRLAEMLEGGGQGKPAGFRVCSSSTGDPGVAVSEGRLLEDLHGRLAAETILLPPLRERIEDVALLARHFITTICEINHLPPIRIVPESLQILERYAWPENVQELRNAMEQAVILTPDGEIRPRDLPDRVRQGALAGHGISAAAVSLARRFRDAKREVVEGFEQSYLRDLMEEHGGNVTAAAQQAGMLRSALQRLLRKYDLKSVEFRKRARRGAAAEQGTRPRR